jgi:hypothetical protein
MTPGVIQIPGDVSIGEAARLMQKEHVPCVLIKDTESSVGIVTHSDIVCKVIAQGLNPYDVQARLVMSVPVQFVEFDQPVDQVTTTLAGASVPFLIVTRNHQPIGFITARDLIDTPKRSEPLIQASVKVYNERPERLTYPAVVTHLGHVGAFVETEAPLDPGARITLEFSLPGAKQPVAAEATVLEDVTESAPSLWPEARPGAGRPVQFNDVKASDQSEISAWILRTRRQTLDTL